MSKKNGRLEMLERLTGGGSEDPFAWYGLALEYRASGRVEDALRTFARLREIDAVYLPAYLMAGQLLLDEDRPEEAREWLEAGVALATERGDAKTRSELETALALC